MIEKIRHFFFGHKNNIVKFYYDIFSDEVVATCKYFKTQRLQKKYCSRNLNTKVIVNSCPCGRWDMKVKDGYLFQGTFNNLKLIGVRLIKIL